MNMHLQPIPEYEGNIRHSEALSVFYGAQRQGVSNSVGMKMAFFQQLNNLVLFLLILIRNALLIALLVAGVALCATYAVMAVAELFSLNIQFMPAFFVLMAWPSLVVYTISSSVLIAVWQANAKNLGLAGFFGAVVTGLLMPSQRFPDLEIIMVSVIGTALVAVPHYLIARKVFSAYFINDTDFVYRADAGEEE